MDTKTAASSGSWTYSEFPDTLCFNQGRGATRGQGVCDRNSGHLSGLCPQRSWRDAVVDVQPEQRYADRLLSFIPSCRAGSPGCFNQGRGATRGQGVCDRNSGHLSGLCPQRSWRDAVVDVQPEQRYADRLLSFIPSCRAGSPGCFNQGRGATRGQGVCDRNSGHLSGLCPQRSWRDAVVDVQPEQRYADRLPSVIPTSRAPWPVRAPGNQTCPYGVQMHVIQCLHELPC